MHIAWFVPPVWKRPWQRWYNYDKVLASTWIRCLQLIPYLATLSVVSQVNTWDKKTQIAIFLRRWGVKEQTLAEELKRKGVKIILDTPVNYFSSQDVPPFRDGVRDQFISFADIADFIFCPSPYTEQFGRKKGYHTVCMEDSIDLKHFRYRKEESMRNDKPELIWSGVSVKAGDLNFIAPAIRLNRWPVTIISDKSPDLDFDFSFIRWRYRSFPKDILKGNIGVFPRTTDNEYVMGHSFFKIGVFLAQHVPVICSPVPSYNQVITELNAISIKELDQELWEQSINFILSEERGVNFDENPVYDFSTEKMATRYRTVFTRLLKS